MKIISWNVNGIRAVNNKGLFVPFVKEYDPDILCLQETKAERGQAEIDLPQYEEYWNSSSTKKGYSGTAIFTKEKPKSVILDIPDDIASKFGGLSDTYGDPNKEGRVLTAEFAGFYLVNVYTPNSKPDLSRLPLRDKKWDPAFLEHVKRLEKHGSTGSPQGKPVIFCGDLNVAHSEQDLANPKANEGEHGFTKEERAGLDRVVSAGYIDTFRHFTPTGNGHYSWWSNFANSRARNVGWRIDYFFASGKLEKKIQKAEILASIKGSDHCPITLEINL